MAKPSPRSVRAFDAAVQLHRAALDRILDRRSVTGLRKLYDAAQADLARKLNRLIRTGRKESMTYMQLRQLLEQTKIAQADIAAQVAAGFVPVTREIAAEGIRQTARTIVDLERRFTGATLTLPIEEAATFQGLIAGRTPSLIRSIESSFKRYGATVTGKIEQELAVSLATGETPLDAISRVERVASVEWWRAERIVRTESAYAFNASHMDATRELADELDDLHSRWCEYVDDVTGRPLDDRVAVDSLVLHGQVVKPGESFVMPTDERISAKLWGKRYTQGPNRPNDRSVTMPWRPHWGTPGWQWRDGRKVPMKLETRSLADMRAEVARLAGR